MFSYRSIAAWRRSLGILAASALLASALLANVRPAMADVTLLNTFANTGFGAEGFPVYVTTGGGGNVVVIDPLQNQVAGNVFTADGSYEFSLTKPDGSGGLANAAGFGTVGPDGSVYVADSTSGVAVFSPTGVQQRFIGSGVVTRALGIAVSSSLVYVTNRTNIAVYGTAGGSVGTLGSAGTGAGQFGLVNGLALDSTANNLYVADYGNNRLDVFTSGGVFESSFGPRSGAGQLIGPQSVAVSGTGLLYVTDATPGVKVFSTSGTYITTFAATLNGSPTTSQTVAVSSTGLIYYAGSTAVAGSAAVYRFFDPAAWAAGTNTFTNAATGPTSVAVGAGQLLGSSLTLDATKGLVVGNTTSIVGGGTLNVTGGSLNTPNLVVDGSARGGANFTMSAGTLTTSSISVSGGGVTAVAGPISTAIAGTISVAGAGSRFKVDQGAVVSATALANMGAGQIVAGANADLIIYNNFTNNAVVNLAGGELDVRGSLTNAAGATIQGNGTVSTTGGLTNVGNFNLAGPSNVLGAVSNAGTIEVSGVEPTIFFGPLSNTGAITIDTGAAVTFEGGVAGNPATAGTLTLQPNSSAKLTTANTVLVVGGLNFAGAKGAWTGRLDLAGDDLIVHNGSLSQIVDQIEQAERSGLASGITSAAAARRLVLAAVLNANGAGGTLLDTFDEVPVGPTDVLVKQTLLADTNLDGKVDVTDLGNLASHYGQTSNATWTSGDFDYSGTVDVSDLGDLASNYGASVTADLGIATPTAATVPEPAAGCVLAFAAVCLARRKR